MNKLTLLAVFALGATSALFISFFSLYFLQNDEGSRLEQLIKERKLIYEQSRNMASIPDESQLSIVPESDILLDLNSTKDKLKNMYFETDTTGEIDKIISHLQMY